MYVTELEMEGGLGAINILLLRSKAGEFVCLPLKWFPEGSLFVNLLCKLPFPDPPEA